MNLTPGSRWKSAVCDTEAVVVRPPAAPATLECGGQPMVAFSAAKPGGLTVDPAHAGGSLLGKRYLDEETGLEALCSKAGAGALSVSGRPLTIKEAKKLPSSD
ncbi:MAG TPA: hypothetical protein VEA44_15155 [Caulobacter sp.]|nr:hypothetical protein [Caulobacter sp.]